MAAPNTKTPSILLEAIKFAGSIDRETPYEELTKVALDAGWVWHLRQAAVEDMGTNSLFHFDVLLGKTDSPDLSVVDTISVAVLAQVGPLSSVARNTASASLLHLFFGRLPPAPAATPAGRAEDYPVREADDSPSGKTARYRDEEYPANETPAVAVVERHTPDGLPIFGDLYALGQPGPVVVDAVLDEIEAVLPDVMSVAALGALWQNNIEAMQYVQDLGTSNQRQALKGLLDRRKAAIEDAGNVAPRRRSAATVN